MLRLATFVRTRACARTDRARTRVQLPRLPLTGVIAALGARVPRGAPTPRVSAECPDVTAEACNTQVRDGAAPSAHAGRDAACNCECCLVQRAALARPLVPSPTFDDYDYDDKVLASDNARAATRAELVRADVGARGRG